MNARAKVCDSSSEKFFRASGSRFQFPVLFCFAVAFFLFSFSGFVSADGMIVPVVPDDPYPLILNHYVTVDVVDSIAKVRVEQEFQNNGWRDLEGTYVFPVPSGGVRNFMLNVNGKTFEGKMLGAQEARALYQQYALERKEASLLEYVGKETFAASVVLPRNEKVKVIIEYEQVLAESGGVIHFFYPLSTERYTTQPIDPVNITINIQSSGKIGFVSSPTHDVDVTRAGNSNVVVSYYSVEIPYKDFQLFYGVTERDYDVKLLAHKQAGSDEGFFLLFVYPSLAEADIEPTPKDIVFVIDTSGSMSGQKIEQAKNALKFVLNRLDSKDKFNIVSFSDEVKSFASELKDANSVNVGDALVFADSLEAGSSTNIRAALEEARLQLKPSSTRAQLVVFLTDGVDTSGNSQEEILSAFRGAGGKIFPFGVGEDVDFELLDRLANDYGDGIPTYIVTDADLEAVLTKFFERITHPLLLDVGVSISSNASSVSASDVLPKRIPDVFLGSQVVLAGKYSGSGDAVVEITGKVGGNAEAMNYPVIFPSVSSNAFVERAWAVKRVGFLLDEIGLEGERAEWVEEVKLLANAYGIPSPYTSYVVVTDKGEQITRDVGAQGAIANLPSASAPFALGSSYEAAESASSSTASQSKSIEGKTFIEVGGVWKDTACSSAQAGEQVEFGSARYLELLQDDSMARFLSAGTNVFVCTQQQAIQVTLGSGSVIVPKANVTLPNPVIPSDKKQFQIPFEIIFGLIVVALVAFVVISLSRTGWGQGAVETHKVLASATRIEILRELNKGERTPSFLSARLGKNASTIVEHLDKLSEAQMIEKIEERGKKYVFYRLTGKGKTFLREAS